MRAELRGGYDILPTHGGTWLVVNVVAPDLQPERLTDPLAWLAPFYNRPARVVARPPQNVANHPALPIAIAIAAIALLTVLL